jgi:hypothetical protein
LIDQNPPATSVGTKSGTHPTGLKRIFTRTLNSYEIFKETRAKGLNFSETHSETNVIQYMKDYSLKK